MENPIFVDPSTFNPIDLFNIVLVNNSQDFISWGIKGDTGANYNHAMIQRTVASVDSQETLFQNVPIKNYMIKSNMLKFWQINNLTETEWQILNKAVLADLALPWWKRFYNYLGIFGQFSRLTWISCPGTFFCSQRVAKYLRLLPRFASVLPENVSPGFEDTFFIAHPELMTCIGYYWED